MAGVHYSYEAPSVAMAIYYAEQACYDFPNVAILEDNNGEWSNEGILVFLNGQWISGINGAGERV